MIHATPNIGQAQSSPVFKEHTPYGTVWDDDDLELLQQLFQTSLFASFMGTLQCPLLWESRMLNQPLLFTSSKAARQTIAGPLDFPGSCQEQVHHAAKMQSLFPCSRTVTLPPLPLARCGGWRKLESHPTKLHLQNPSVWFLWRPFYEASIQLSLLSTSHTGRECQPCNVIFFQRTHNSLQITLPQFSF